jgi:hypothetical protein
VFVFGARASGLGAPRTVEIFDALFWRTRTELLRAAYRIDDEWVARASPLTYNRGVIADLTTSPRLLPAWTLMAALASGCSSTPAAGPDARITPTSEDGSEVASSVQRPASLTLLSQSDLAAGKAAYRPDVTAIGGELWLAYNTGEGVMLQRLGADLAERGERVALLPARPAGEMTTDVRVDSAKGQPWMAYETVLIPEVACGEHFLNAAAYTGSPPRLSAHAERIASGCALNKEFVEHPTGLPANPEIADDPTPFCHRGARYVLTRGWGTSTVHHLRKLDAELRVSEETLLDTSAVVPGRQMSQSALLHIGGRPHLVAGFSSGVWVPPNTSDLYLLPLSDDLRSFSGRAVRLPVTGRTFPTRITRARHVNGTLIINFIDAFVVADSLKVSEHLALFDAGAGFSLLGQLQVQDHAVADSHSSFEVLDDRLYLFQQQEGQKISAKVFQLLVQ